MKPGILHAEAGTELQEALDYYEGKRTGLGGDFLREFEAALPRVCENLPAYAAENDPEFSTVRCIGGLDMI